MLGLSFSSLRFRPASFLATFVSVFLGASILMAFASLFDTAAAPGVSTTDKNSLTTIGWVVGGWGVLIVAFGVAATLNLAVRQRQTEMALLKAAGATPGQVGRMIVGEAAVVTVIAAVPAIPVGLLGGHRLVATLIDHHELAAGTGARFGSMALGVGLGDVIVAALVAALFSGRRAARASVRDALTAAAVEPSRLGRRRIVAGVFFVVVGVYCAVMSATLFKNQTYVTESLAGESCIWTSVGFGFLSPALIRLGERVFGPLVRPFTGVSGYLADLNVRQRSSESAGVLIPFVLFIGLAGGSLELQQVQNHARAVTHAVQTADEKGVATTNFVIVGMLAVFAAVVLINIAVSTTVNRRREFGLQRVIGSTPAQITRMVFAETFVTAATGLVLGLIAAAVGNIGYSIALSSTALPHIDPLMLAGVLAAAVAITFLANLTAARRVLGSGVLKSISLRTS